jgi:hypothetical protein
LDGVALLGIKFPTSVEEAEQSALGFQSISTQGCIWNCVAAVDGYHLQIIMISKKRQKMSGLFIPVIIKHTG